MTIPRMDKLHGDTCMNVPMFVPKLGLIKPRQAYVCPQLRAFCMKLLLGLFCIFERPFVSSVFKATGIRLIPFPKMEVHSTIYDSKISKLWTTKQCFEIIPCLLVSVFNMVSKPKLSRFTAKYSSCDLQNAIFLERPKLYRNERN